MSRVQDQTTDRIELREPSLDHVVGADPAGGADGGPGWPESQGSRARSIPTPGSVLRTITIALSVVGLLAGTFLVYEFWLTGLLESRTQAALLSQFKHSLVLTDTPDLVTPPPGQPVGVIEIPTVGVEQVVVQGTGSADTKLGPGHDPASPAPGQAGNSVIVGRRTAYGGPFAKLGGIRVGDSIDVLTRQGQFTYLVTKTEIASLGNTAVAAPSTADRLTLITADPAYAPTQEIVIVAALEGQALQAPGPLPLAPAGEQPGLSAGNSGWGFVLLWGELLLAAIGGTWYLLRRRWSPAVTYLLAAPVLITLAFLFYGAVDGLLPPSL